MSAEVDSVCLHVQSYWGTRIDVVTASAYDELAQTPPNSQTTAHVKDTAQEVIGRRTAIGNAFSTFAEAHCVVVYVHRVGIPEVLSNPMYGVEV